MSTLRVAVIGAGGQIGRTILECLARDPSVSVRAICRNELTAAPLRLAGLDVRCGAMADAPVAATLVGDCDVLVNCAAASSLPGTAKREDRATVDGLLTVKGPRRIIHFSSVAVYGSCIDARNTFERPRPDQPYGRDKLDLERYLEHAAPRHGKHEVLILRMGHVYGAEQWVSRMVLDHAKKPGWRLPQNGAGESNAVHVKNVAAAVRSLVRGSQTGTLNLFDSPQSTWRHVFDWNTRAVGLSPVPPLDRALSEQLRDDYRRLARTPFTQIAHDAAAWGRSLPLSLASSSLALRLLIMTTLSKLQSTRLETHVLKRFAAAQLARRSAPRAVEQSWLFSAPAPGPCVEYRAEVTPDDARAVAEWHKGYSSPDALAPFARVGDPPRASHPPA